MYNFKSKRNTESISVKIELNLQLWKSEISFLECCASVGKTCIASWRNMVEMMPTLTLVIELKTTLFRGNNLNVWIFDFSYIFSSSKVQSPQRVCFWFYTHQVHLCAFFRHWINLAKLSTENTNYMDFSKLIHGFVNNCYMCFLPFAKPNKPVV